MMFFQNYLKDLQDYLYGEGKENVYQMCVDILVFNYLHKNEWFLEFCSTHNIDVESQQGIQNFQEWMWG